MICLRKVACFAVIFLASFAFGQNSQSFAVVDNTLNCSGSSTFACWTILPTQFYINSTLNTAYFSSLSVGVDGTVYGVNSTLKNALKWCGFNACNQGGTPTSWTNTNLPQNVIMIAVQDATHIFALINNHTGCAGGSYQIVQANSNLLTPA